jgi:cardiolipin synthase
MRKPFYTNHYDGSKVMQKTLSANLGAIIRLLVAALAVIAQFVMLIVLVSILKQLSAYVYTFLQVAGVISIFLLVNRQDSPSYKIAWILVVFLLPVFGFILYILWGRMNRSRLKRAQTKEIYQRGYQFLLEKPEIFEDLDMKFPNRSRIAKFLKYNRFPLYHQQGAQYLKLGEECFESMIKDLEQAKHFIFIEYYIVSMGILWDNIYAILKRKSAEGVEIRFLYDDFGCALLVPFDFIKRLKKDGIKALAFNPIFKHISNLYMNYRNHQKMVIIDGVIGYTGGVNLADEYANYHVKHGHWKDTAIRLTGEPVWSLTVSYLQTWSLESRQRMDDYGYYQSLTQNALWEYETSIAVPLFDSFIMPFTDGPANNPQNPAKDVCHQMIESSSKYIYITTPYLILEEDMLDSLCRAAESGVDVRIVTPSIPDHWYVHLVTRFHYGRLIQSGVSIYEYTPGFMHAKMIISDDDHGLIGTINFDFRSFYLQYENAVWLCGSKAIEDIKNDLEYTFSVSQKITIEDWKGRRWYTKVAAAGFRLFATLM